MDHSQGYAARANAMNGERETGSIIRTAAAVHESAGHINVQLLRILESLRQSPPSGISGDDTGPTPRRPLSDVLERTQHEQSRTSELLAEIESFVG